jgi:hypothetical protein
MSKVVRLMIALTVVLFAAQVAVAKPAGKTTKTVSSKPSSKPVKATQPKSDTTKIKASKPAKPTKTTGATTKATKPTKQAKTTKLAKTTTSTKGKTTTTATTTTSTKPSTTTTSSAGTSTSTTEHVGPEMNSKLQKKLGEDSKHAARLEAKLSLPEGISIQDAAAGFKNWGQFNAAVNTSNRLGIPFNDLKAAMTGWTLPNPQTGVATKTTTGILSLGQAQQAFNAGTLPTYPYPSATGPTDKTSVTAKLTDK